MASRFSLWSPQVRHQALLSWGMSGSLMPRTWPIFAPSCHFSFRSFKTLTLLPAHSSKIHPLTVLSLWMCCFFCRKSFLLLRAPEVLIPRRPMTRKVLQLPVWLQ